MKKYQTEFKLEVVKRGGGRARRRHRAGLGYRAIDHARPRGVVRASSEGGMTTFTLEFAA